MQVSIVIHKYVQFSHSNLRQYGRKLQTSQQ